MKLGKVVAVAAVVTTLNVVPFQDANAWSLGTFGSGGTTYKNYGNTTYGSDGSTWKTYGNTTYGTYGNYGSFGGGVTCKTYGNTVYCN